MEQKMKVIKRRGRWAILVPQGYVMDGYTAYSWNPRLYGFGRDMAGTMDTVRRHAEWGTFVKAVR